MAKMLNFIIGSKRFSLSPTKIERKKLYGWTELQVHTPEGIQCIPAGLDNDGVTLIPYGATKTGMMTESGLWMDRRYLVAIDNEGKKAPAVASSFDTDIKLTYKADVNDLLDCNINAVYQIYSNEAKTLAGMIGDDIYRFPFSYRGGYEPSDAFLLMKDGNLFILTGTKRDYEFIGLAQNGVIDDDNEFDINEELDFRMM